jgi:hypothetical protein
VSVVDDPPGAAVKVSVIVPVFNPGRDIERCIDSLLQQSLPPDQYEAVFVDDGSTDETPARLDALAAEHPNVRVFHIPNSGWPGRPRNVGVAHARGEYVQFVDQDDRLGPEALERLYVMGRHNGADIVIGKVAGNFRSRDAGATHAIRGVPEVLFRRNRDSCTIQDAPLIDSLTPHKMFRTAFLREHALAFPDGRMRLEDQLFVVPAYFAAGNVSVLSDHVCYFYTEREDGRNAGSVQIDPAAYCADLRQVLGVVMANTEPGELRDRLLRRFLRTEMLGRLSEPAYPAYEPQFRSDLLAAMRPVALELIPPGVDAGLGAVGRLRASLLRADRPDALLALAQRCSAVRAAPRLEALSWTRGRLAVSVSTGIELAPGRPLVVVERDGRHLLDPAVTDGLVGEPIDVAGELESVRATLFARDRTTGAQWSIQARAHLDWTGVADDGEGSASSPVVTADATIDPLTLAGGAPLGRGAWDVWVRIVGLGLDRTARVGPDRSPALDTRAGALLVGDGAAPVVALFDREGGLVVDVDRCSTTVAAAVAARSTTVVRDGRQLCAWLPVATAGRVEGIAVPLVLRASGASGASGASRGMLRGRLEPRGGKVLLRADAGRSVTGVERGRYELAARFDGDEGPEVPLGTVKLGLGGRITMVGDRRIGRVDGTAWVLREWGRAAKRRMPPAVRRVLGSARAAIR